MYDVAIATIFYPIGSHFKRFRFWFGDYGLVESYALPESALSAEIVSGDDVSGENVTPEFAAVAELKLRTIPPPRA